MIHQPCVVALGRKRPRTVFKFLNRFKKSQKLYEYKNHKKFTSIKNRKKLLYFLLISLLNFNMK